nr:beta' subunit of RNA polymerase [Dinophyceae sp. MRD-151]
MKLKKSILFLQFLTPSSKKSHNEIKKKLRNLNIKYKEEFPIHYLQVRIASPNQIRSLCLRKSSEGFSIGRVWTSRTVNYKDLKPIPGGLFCESAFGPLQRGICACKRTRWRSYPKSPKKLRRTEILYCSHCSTKTIYSDPYNSFFEKNFSHWPDLHFQAKVKNYEKIKDLGLFSNFLRTLVLNLGRRENSSLKKTTCKCGKVQLHIQFFLSISRICRLCKTSTKPAFYGKISAYPIQKNYMSTFRKKKKENPASLEVVSQSYQPGFCVCGRISTEVPWDESIFCSHCGTELSLEVIPRRYRMGYLPLSIPIAHFWYRHYEPRPLSRLTGFSHRLFPLILYCERAVAGEAFLVLKRREQSYFSPEFQPAERLSNSPWSNIIITGFGFPKTPKTFDPKVQKDKFLLRNRTGLINLQKVFLKKDTLYPSNTTKRNIIFSEIEACIFPWYFLYRDIPFFFLFEKEKESIEFITKIESLESLNKLLVASPKRSDEFLHIYQKFESEIYPFQEKDVSKCRFGVRMQIHWLSQTPSRTGGELLLNRLIATNQKDWRVQSRRRLNDLKKDMEVFEKQGSLDKNERVSYRRLIRSRNQILIRIRILREIQMVNLQIHWLMLQCLPILPPDLRPNLSLKEGKIIVADVNCLYQRVLERNSRIAQRRRLTKFQVYRFTRDLRYHERLLQEALECLFENGLKGKRREKDSKQRAYKSLAEVLKGKRGRFRNNLLGKRVDYSGRSVIISGPELTLYQCGLPPEIIFTLFQAFLIRFLVNRVKKGKKIQTRLQARLFLDQQQSRRLLVRKQILYSLPVLLNRAPTLHRFGFQAFQAQLISCRSIQLHPLACSGFNADFDGDQIAVHVPLSPHARAEAWRLIIPGAHFFSPATREPAFLPSQDMILGIYYLTTQKSIFSFFNSTIYFRGFSRNRKFTKKKQIVPMLFSERREVFRRSEKENLKIYQQVWLYIKKSNILDYESNYVPYERRLSKKRIEQKFFFWIWEKKISPVYLFRTTVGRILFSFLLNYLPKLISQLKHFEKIYFVSQ